MVILDLHECYDLNVRLLPHAVNLDDLSQVRSTGVRTTGANSKVSYLTSLLCLSTQMNTFDCELSGDLIHDLRSIMSPNFARLNLGASTKEEREQWRMVENEGEVACGDLEIERD